MFKKTLFALLSSCLFQVMASPWYNTYDFGPVVSQVVSYKDDPVILRGHAIEFNQGKNKVTAYYDSGSMNFRYLSAGRISFKGTPWDGAHGGNSIIEGDMYLSSSPSLAWAYKGSWQDPREKDFAPLPKNYVHYKGYYLHGDSLVYSYTVGDKVSSVFEMPELNNEGVFTRHFSIAESKEELLLKVIDNKDLKLGKNHFIKASEFKIENNGQGLHFIRIPAGSKDLHFSISYSAKPLSEIKTRGDLQSYTQGSDARWPQVINMKGELKGYESDYFIVDQIPIPEKNPWGSFMRIAGFDYFSDGDKAAFCTWNGDVWIVSNLNDDLQNVEWKRFAAGMNETLGLCIVNDEIFVNGKDQITRLHDLNKDGEADFYENFNNDCKITKNFHEFTFDLDADKYGNLYFAKAAPVLHGGRGFDETHEHHGVVYKVSADGKKSEIFASGLRAPGGMAINEEGTIATTGENEGTYVQACKINYLKKGDYAGVLHPGNGMKETDKYQDPLCYLPISLDNSGGGQVWVPENSWGDLGGNLIHLSYGQSKAYTVFQEELNGQTQGGVVELPIQLMSSGMRIRFNPIKSEEAIITGFKGWQTNATLNTAINRVRYKGKKMLRPLEVRSTTQGLYLTFNEKLDEQSVKSLDNYSVERWNYLYSEQYGSAHFATDTPEKVLEEFKKRQSKAVGRIGFPKNQDGEKVYVKAVTLLEDQKTVFLKLHNMKPADNMKVSYAVKTAGGQELNSQIYNTIYQLAEDNRELADMISVADLELQEKINTYPLGAALEMKSSNDWEYDVKVSRLLTLQLEKGSLPSPFLGQGPFSQTYEGYLISSENDKVKFSTLLKGDFHFELNGKTVLAGKEFNKTISSDHIQLAPGAHKFKLTFKSTTEQESYFNLKWQGKKFPLGPISPNSLRHKINAMADEFKRMRDGRLKMAESRCISCHKTDDKNLMPEFYMDSPSLVNVGGRLNKNWMAEWIANPKKFNQHSNMPSLANEQEAKHIAEFLASEMEEDKSESIKGNSTIGAELFYDLGCISCHTRPEETQIKGERLLLSNVANKFKSQALKDYLLSPEKLFKWTKMPNFKLSETEASDLSAYLLKKSGASQIADFKADKSLGKQLFSERGCINCHGGDHENHFAAIPFEDLEGKRKGCLGWRPKINFGFTGKDKYVFRTLFNDKKHAIESQSPHEFSERQIETLNCNACHSRDNAAAKWESFANDIKDLKTHHKDRGHLDQSRPQLTYAGEKIQKHTLQKYLDGSLEYNSREWLLARMPSFPARAEKLAKSMALEHGTYQLNEDEQGSSEQFTVGKKLVGTGGFGCIICHDVGIEKAMAAFEVKGVNLQYSADRLNKDFYHRWMMNPAHIVPTTRMPKYADDKGKSTLPDYGNDAEKQFEAIFQYLKSLNKK